jgi:7-keto-8-aminopelargonate synthetase-like enzyme
LDYRKALILQKKRDSFTNFNGLTVPANDSVVLGFTSQNYQQLSRNAHMIAVCNAVILKEIRGLPGDRDPGDITIHKDNLIQIDIDSC